MANRADTIGSLLRPSSVAVIGASRREGSIGNKIFNNLLEASFNGPVFPVNPQADVISAVKAYPTIVDIPENVDLAVIVVPAEAVLESAEQCGVKGVKALVVISAGFAENNTEGAARQRDLAAICRRHRDETRRT